MKRSVVAAVGLCLFLVAGNAHAVLFQFYTTNGPLAGMEVCPNQPSGCPASDVDLGPLSFTNGGINVDVDASGSSSLSRVYADYNPEEGGLGALLGDLEENELTNPDNVVAGQSLTFAFDQVITMYSIVNFDQDHSTGFDDNADYELWIDEGTSNSQVYAIAASDMVSLPGYTGKNFEFRAINDIATEGFYVSAFTVALATPEPGTALLVGMGLVGLVASRRRQTA